MKKILSVLLCLTLLCPSVFVTADMDEAEAYWPSYRKTDSNMGITNALTPVSADKAAVKWSVNLQDIGGNVPGSPIIAQDALYTASEGLIFKLSLETGEVLAQNSTEVVSGQTYTPLTYADGMVFAPLDKGTVQAFDAETLESLWIYRDPLGGQALTPAAYSDGYIYTGFWNGEKGQANYACIPAVNENPEGENQALWTFPADGGFYWAGALVLGEYILFGKDDGTAQDSNPSSVYCLNKLTGEVIDTLEITGDQRSSISYDAATGRIYFTTKCGMLYSAAVLDGSFTDVLELDLGGASTSTPLVHNGRLYVGVSGPSNFSKDGHSVKVIDAAAMSELYSVPMDGYPQCSMLLSTGYEGKYYVYATSNSAKGGVTVIEDSDGQTEPVYQTLYTPAQEAQNYNISSIICDSSGTLYYKNDSPYLTAITVGENETPGGDDKDDEDDDDIGGGDIWDDELYVTFRLIGDSLHETQEAHTKYVTWIATKTYTVAPGSTAADLFEMALSSAGLAYEGLENGYISAITAPDILGGYRLEEFSNGSFSGWMYYIDGTHPETAITDYVLDDGDQLIMHYSDDYTAESGFEGSTGSGDWINAPDVNPTQEEDFDPGLDEPDNSGGGFSGDDPQATATPLPSPSVSPTPSPKPTASPSPAPTSTPKPKQFSDVGKDHWAYSYIMDLWYNGLIQGKTESEFAPEDTITRAEFTALLARASGEEIPATKEQFVDVPNGAWYAGYVAWAVQAGITNGTSDNTFSPDECITREDISVMAVRYVESIMQMTLPPGQAEPFADEADIAPYARDAVALMRQAAILSGSGDNRFYPKNYTTRAETAKILSMVLNFIK